MEAHAQDVEVDFEAALAEEAQNEESTPRAAPGGTTPVTQNFDQAPPPPQPSDIEQAEAQKRVAQEDLEALAPKAQAREWKIGPAGDNQLTYIQEELSVIGEIQWFALLGDFLDKAMSGDNAVSLSALMSPPQRGAETYRVQDLQDADTFVHALGKLVAFAPEFMEKSICIWLAVPDYEWDLVRGYMKMSPNKGGMSHDMFEEILATFIDQNYAAIDRFFRERFGRLRDRYQARAREASLSRSSKH